MKNVTLLFAFLLAACVTTPDELADREPVAVFQTSRTTDEVAECLTMNITNVGLPTIIRGARRDLITFETAGTTSLMLTKFPTGRVEMRRTTSLIGNIEKVRGCM